MRFIHGIARLVGLRRKKSFPFVGLGIPYREPRRVLRALSKNLSNPVDLRDSIGTSEVEKNELYQIWSRIPHGHKWIHYFDTYQTAVSHFHGQPIRMLEIGIYQGSSLKMWREYLPRESVIVGIDIDPTCTRFASDQDRVFVRIGDQSNEQFLKEVVDEFGPFDFILDDGSHLCSDMIASFNYLFDYGLRDHGIYLVEDTHSNFWRSHRDRRYSFIDFSKDLVDLMHAPYWKSASRLFDKSGRAQDTKSVSVPRICSLIREIRFLDSLVVIYKKRRAGIPVAVHS